MSSSPLETRPDHMQRTAQHLRDEAVSSAVVTEMVQLSPTVKGLMLQVEDGRFSFKAGQWVDFHIPSISTVGGFSITSAPRSAIKCKRFELAVKCSKHPPANWIHSQCKVGSIVTVRVGGNFHYDLQQSDDPHDLLLVAGGVGINPLLSIMRHVHHMKKNSASSSVIPRMTHLLFSASTEPELIFKDQIVKLCENCDDLRATFLVTKEMEPNSQSRVGRIDRAAIRKALSQFPRDTALPVRAYICGPGSMIDDVESCLAAEGVPEQQIHYEKWW